MAEAPGVDVMPGSGLLKWLGRILPGEFVERVAEPALNDEAHRWSRSGQVPPLGRTRFVCSCLLVGMPQLFWAHRRPTVVTLFLAASALMVLVAFILWAPDLYQVTTP